MKVALLDGKIIGKMKIEKRGHIMGIYGFVVNPEYRGKGLGREIINCAIKDIIGSGYTKLYLEVDAENYIAFHLYELVGFEIQTVFDYYIYTT